MFPKTLIAITCVGFGCNGDNLHPAIDAPAGGHHDDAGSQEPPLDGPPASALLVRYHFEEDSTVVADSSGRGKDGTLSDATAWTANGRTGRGLAMSGAMPASQYVSLPDGILTGTSDFTIAAWIKLNSTNAWARIYDIGNGLTDPANRFMYLTINGFTGPVNDGVHASSYGGAPANEIIVGSSTQLPTGVWKHVVLTGHNGDRHMYIDGYPVASVTGGPVVQPQEMEPLAPNSWIGKSRFPADPGFDGVMDDFEIYNEVLSDPEIADLAWPQHDYSSWRFDEGSGTTTKDSSDNAIPTVLGDGVTWTTGRLGHAIDLPGAPAGATGPSIQLGGNPLASCTTELTVAAWIKLRTLTAWSRVFDFGTASTAFVYLAPTDGAGMHFAMVAPTGVFDMVTATPPIPADSAWHHVAVTVNAAGLVTLYADGASVMSQTSATVKPGDFANVTDNWLGKSRFPDPYLNGSIDEMRISCRAYAADEIKGLSRQ